MSDAPERIWAVHWGTDGAVINGAWADTVRHFGGGVEYVRADIADTQRGAGGWKPIETAPKDGTHIMAFWPDVWGMDATQTQTWFGPFEAGGLSGWQTAHEYADGHSTPTHWRPLPEPPK